MRFIHAVPRLAPTGAVHAEWGRFCRTGRRNARLHEFAVWPLTAAPGDIIQVRLIWSWPMRPPRDPKGVPPLTGCGRHRSRPTGQRTGRRVAEKRRGGRPENRLPTIMDWHCRWACRRGLFASSGPL